MIIDAINSYFDFCNADVVTQSHFLKQVINHGKFSKTLQSLSVNRNTTCFFIHPAQVVDKEDPVNKLMKKRYFMFITLPGQCPPPFNKKSEWLNESVFRRITVKRGVGNDFLPSLVLEKPNIMVTKVEDDSK